MGLQAGSLRLCTLSDGAAEEAHVEGDENHGEIYPILDVILWWSV